MADIVDAPTRSRMMAAVRGRDTRPELVLRKALHARGLRYRVHAAALPGRPDFVFPKHRVAAFVHGCFWHGHDCRLFRMPSTRTEFWTAKIDANRERDRRASDKLQALGFRVLIVWECALRGHGRIGLETASCLACAWILDPDKSNTLEIRGA